MIIRSLHLVLLSVAAWLPGSALAADDNIKAYGASVALDYFVATDFQAANLSISNTHWAHWLLNGGLGYEIDGSVGISTARTSSLDVQYDLSADWSIGAGLASWDGSETVTTRSVNVRVSYLSRLWGTDFIFNRQLLHLSTRGSEDQRRTRSESVDGMGAVFRFYPNEIVGIAARYMDYTQGFNTAGLNLAHRPRLLRILSTDTLSVLSALNKRQASIDATVLLQNTLYGVQLAWAASAIDSSKTAAQSLYMEHALSARIDLNIELSRQSAESGGLANQFSIGARFYW